MGLDMYLYRLQEATPEQREALQKVGREDRHRWTLDLGDDTRVEIKERIGYWREANHVHNWFVENVQGGDDDCREYEVEREQLRELEEVIQKVLDASKLVPGKVSVGYTLDESGERIDILEDGLVIEDATIANELLSRARGCFFGGEEYDQYYVQDLHDTKAILNTAFSSPADTWFIYRASW